MIEKTGMRFVSPFAAKAAVAERRASMEAGARPPGPGPESIAAAKAIGEARMSAAGVQPRTVAASGAVPHVVEHVAIVVDRGGGVEVHRSAVTALFDRSACAVARLHADGLIGWPGFRAALAFAWAGDRVLGGARVRTSGVEPAIAGAILPDGLAEAERDALARQRWLLARARLSAAQFRIVDRVMRHDESAAAAARAAYPRYRDRKKLCGMGDQALIEATQSLAVEYGFEAEKRNEPFLRLR
jgi:hypothetical protein